MSRIYVPTTGPDDWRSLLADPEKHWKPGYSAMAAARSWEDARGLPSEISAVLGRDTDLLLAIPEHKVPLPGGRRDSQCDVFALIRIGDETCSLAVEAKVNETFGPTIGEWMYQPTAGRTKRLTAVCEVLGVACPPPNELRYQLFHRTAAAVFEASRFKTDSAAMVVQSFSPENRWFDDFAAFARYLGLRASPGSSSSRPLPDGRSLIIGWASSPYPVF